MGQLGTSPFKMARDIGGYNGFALRFSQDKYSGLLVASAEQTLTVPDKFTDRCVAIFAYRPSSAVWVAVGATAVIPVGAIAAGASELNPIAREVDAGDVLHFISGVNTEIGIVFYAI